MPRPTKLTPELCTRVAELLRQGHYRSDVIASLGISEPTFYNWLNRGKEEPDSIYGEFELAVSKAPAESKILAINVVNKAALAGKWEAIAWKLRCQHPEQYGDKVIVELREKMQENLLERLRSGLDPETFRRCLDVILEEDSPEVSTADSEH